MPAKHEQTYDYALANLDGPRREFRQIAQNLARATNEMQVDQLYDALPTPIGVEDGGNCG